MRTNTTMEKCRPHNERKDDTSEHHEVANCDRSRHAQNQCARPTQTPPTMENMKYEWCYYNRETESKTSPLTKTSKPCSSLLCIVVHAQSRLTSRAQARGTKG